MAKQLSEVIKDRIKALRMPRYKLVCSVVIGQNSGQAVRNASRCLWDADNDGFASASYANRSLLATATVYAVYYDWSISINYMTAAYFVHSQGTAFPGHSQFVSIANANIAYVSSLSTVLPFQTYFLNFQTEDPGPPLATSMQHSASL